MKFLSVLLLCVAVAIAASAQKREEVIVVSSADVAVADSPVQTEVESRNILLNALVRQLWAYLRRVINEGSFIFGTQPLDPLDLEIYELNIPAGLVNLGLVLRDVHVTGFGGFVVHFSDLNPQDMTFDVDISFPQIRATASSYDFTGDFFSAIPLYGKGQVLFDIKDFRFQARLNLIRSDNGKSVLIRSIDNPAFQMPHFESQLTGVIGGGDIDHIVNAVIEDILIGYVNRFSNALSPPAARWMQNALNQILDGLDTWRYLAPFA